MTGAKRFFLNPVPEKVVDLTDRDVLVARTIAQVASELEPGEGGILVQAGERLAAFMDADGRAAPDVGPVHAHGVHGGVEHRRPRVRVPVPRLALRPAGEVVNGPAARPLPPA